MSLERSEFFSGGFGSNKHLGKRRFGWVCCCDTSKINVTPKGVYTPFLKLHSILAVANLLAHNNISQICYCGQISLQSAAVNSSFSDSLAPLRVTFILLVMVKVNATVYSRMCLVYNSKHNSRNKR